MPTEDQNDSPQSPRIKLGYNPNFLSDERAKEIDDEVNGFERFQDLKKHVAEVTKTLVAIINSYHQFLADVEAGNVESDDPDGPVPHDVNWEPPEKQ